MTAALRSDGSRFPECDESRESDRGLSTGRDQPKQTRDGSGTWKTCSKKLFHVGDVVNGRKTSLVVLDVIGDEPTGIQGRAFKLHCDLRSDTLFSSVPSAHTQSPFLSRSTADRSTTTHHPIAHLDGCCYGLPPLLLVTEIAMPILDTSKRTRAPTALRSCNRPVLPSICRTPSFGY